MLKKGSKVKFMPTKDFGTLKANHIYNGIYVGKDVVSYRNMIISSMKIVEEQKKKTSVKPKAIKTTEYKTFADLCFQMAVCIRDDFTSIISGAKGTPFDWQYIQAGHWLSRKYWSIRHNPRNCHAITSGENYQMSLGNIKTIMNYAEECEKRYGKDVYKELEEKSKEETKLNIGYLKNDCYNCYKYMKDMCEEWNKKKPTKINCFDLVSVRMSKQPKAKILLSILEKVENGAL